MMENSIIVFILATFFMISCNQKEKRSSSETQKEAQKKSINQEKKNPEKKEAVKTVKPFVKVLDTIPSKKTKRTLEEYKVNLKKLDSEFPKDYTWAEIQSIIPRWR